jgi:hypothetical protein
MSEQGDGESVGGSAWDAFSGRHPGHRFLACDPLYSLSEGLIDSILKEVPDFFSAQDEQFERDLAREASFGFFLRRAYGRPGGAEGQSFTASKNATAGRIDEMLGEELARAGADAQDAGEFFERAAEQREAIVARQDAYAAWLVMNPVYRAEVRTLRECWGEAVRAAGQFPRLPMWLMPDQLGGASQPVGFREECYAFFLRWGLSTLFTWDWPVPMEPDLNVGLQQDVNLLSAGGVILFVPWYLLRGEKLDLGEVVRQCRVGSAPAHLLCWVNKRGGRGSDPLGDARYGTIRWLYRYHELVLLRRYPEACEGNLQRLDVAFAKVLGRDEDSVKKLRLELRRSRDGDVDSLPSPP